MKEALDFLLKTDELKTMPRTGLIWLKVENPETVAEHIFRGATTAWLLGAKKNLNTEKIIKISLSHDLCEVYTGDKTPFWGLIPKDGRKRKQVLKRWIRLPIKEKEKRERKRHETEKKSLLRLIKHLEPRIRKDIFSSWLDYEKGLSKEGRFVKQVDRIEGMIEALERLDKKDYVMITPWWEEADEAITDPLLLEFLKVVQKKFYGRLPKEERIRLNIPEIKARYKRYRKRRELENILNFILQIGKLKKMPRLYWVIRDIKKPETVASHIFTVALMSWIFGARKKTKYSMEKLLKMALCHEVSAVYTGDTTPYDKILPKEKKKKKKILEKWPRLSQKAKTKRFIREFKIEKKAFSKLSSRLKPPVKKEIIQLWKEYRNRSAPEGHFLSQLNALAVLLQALLYEEREKGFSSAPIWEWAFEISDDPINFALMEEMKKKFY